MEGMNINKKAGFDRNYYRFNDLSKVETKTLKNILKGYQSALLSNSTLESTRDEIKEIVFRVEGELLGRKEIIIDENLFSES